MARKTTPKAAPVSKAARKSPKATPAKKAATPAQTGPSKATLEFAAKVVRLRDREGLPWKLVAERLGVPYDHNGSSRLRRAYILGEGRTVGVREAAPKAAPAPKAAKAKAGTTRKAATPKLSPAAARRARQAKAAKAAKAA